MGVRSTSTDQLLRQRVRRWAAVLLPLDYRRAQYGLYLAGCLVFAVGATCFIEADMGTDPLDVFALGVRDHTPLTIGLAQAGFAALMLLCWVALQRRVPSVWPFVTFLFCGTLIDVLLATRVVADVPVPATVTMLAGVVLCAFGSAYIIMSGIGIRAMDLVALALAERMDRPFWVFKAALETLLLVVGWALGGPVGIGTAYFLVLVGYLIQPVMSLNQRVIGVPNHGLRVSSGDSVPARPLPGLT